MTDWVKSTDTGGSPNFVNLATAMGVCGNDKKKYTLVSYPGSVEDVFRVRERPEAILVAREPDSSVP